MKGGLNLESRAGFGGDYGRFYEACSTVNDLVPLSVVDLLSLVIQGVEAMSRASILQVRTGALKQTLLSNNMGIGEL